MPNERKRNRLYPKEFSDFQVLLESEEITLVGQLANVSETGLCFLLRTGLLEEEGMEPSSESFVLEGCILSKKDQERVEFQGNIAWSKPMENNPLVTAYGISFLKPIVLSETLILRNMSFE